MYSLFIFFDLLLYETGAFPITFLRLTAIYGIAFLLCLYPVYKI